MAVIPGAPNNPYKLRRDVEYSKAEPSRCPVCGGSGSSSEGFFSCGECDAISVVEDGRVFVPEPDGGDTGVHAMPPPQDDNA